MLTATLTYFALFLVVVVPISLMAWAVARAGGKYDEETEIDLPEYTVLMDAYDEKIVNVCIDNLVTQAEELREIVKAARITGV